MGHVAITFEADHTETERVPLDEALTAFTEALRTRGYQGEMEVEWSGDLRRQSINRDGTGGALLERPRRDAEEGQDGFTSDASKDYEYQAKGGGSYDIYVDGEVVDTVRGQDAAESWQG